MDFQFHADYIIHAASNAYPAVFQKDPVGTIMSNIDGTKRLLDYARETQAERFLFVSSGEVYGCGDEEIKSFPEGYSGHVEPLSPRACYPMAKRTAETLCCSFAAQFGTDAVIVRPCHIYGPNTADADNRASVQFVNNVLNGEDIVLKSRGEQLRSYCYIADCASGILTVLLRGKSGNAYNIANSEAIITIAGFAGVLAENAGKKVVFEIPTETERAQASPIPRQVLDSSKLEFLGWKGRFSVEEGIRHLLEIVEE